MDIASYKESCFLDELFKKPFSDDAVGLFKEYQDDPVQGPVVSGYRMVSLEGCNADEAREASDWLGGEIKSLCQQNEGIDQFKRHDWDKKISDRSVSRMDIASLLARISPEFKDKIMDLRDLEQEMFPLLQKGRMERYENDPHGFTKFIGLFDEEPSQGTDRILLERKKYCALRILRLDPLSTIEDFKALYKKLVLGFHSDKTGEDVSSKSTQFSCLLFSMKQSVDHHLGSLWQSICLADPLGNMIKPEYTYTPYTGTHLAFRFSCVDVGAADLFRELFKSQKRYSEISERLRDEVYRIEREERESEIAKRESERDERDRQRQEQEYKTALEREQRKERAEEIWKQEMKERDRLSAQKMRSIEMRFSERQKEHEEQSRMRQMEFEQQTKQIKEQYHSPVALPIMEQQQESGEQLDEKIALLDLERQSIQQEKVITKKEDAPVVQSAEASQRDDGQRNTDTKKVVSVSPDIKVENPTQSVSETVKLLEIKINEVECDLRKLSYEIGRLSNEDGRREYRMNDKKIGDRKRFALNDIDVNSKDLERAISRMEKACNELNLFQSGELKGRTSRALVWSYDRESQYINNDIVNYRRRVNSCVEKWIDSLEGEFQKIARDHKQQVETCEALLNEIKLKLDGLNLKDCQHQPHVKKKQEFLDACNSSSLPALNERLKETKSKFSRFESHVTSCLQELRGSVSRKIEEFLEGVGRRKGECEEKFHEYQLKEAS